ncbi:hypothetical protein D3C85_985210 [compost metagenome]
MPLVVSNLPEPAILVCSRAVPGWLNSMLPSFCKVSRPAMLPAPVLEPGVPPNRKVPLSLMTKVAPAPNCSVPGPSDSTPDLPPAAPLPAPSRKRPPAPMTTLASVIVSVPAPPRPPVVMAGLPPPLEPLIRSCSATTSSAPWDRNRAPSPPLPPA